jgi:hypothetical protein
MPSRADLRAPRIHGLLTRVATKSDEKCGLVNDFTNTGSYSEHHRGERSPDGSRLGMRPLSEPRPPELSMALRATKRMKIKRVGADFRRLFACSSTECQMTRRATDENEKPACGEDAANNWRGEAGSFNRAVRRKFVGVVVAAIVRDSNSDSTACVCFCRAGLLCRSCGRAKAERRKGEHLEGFWFDG